jgi:D-3-phosphoglycerate dehydrogenase
VGAKLLSLEQLLSTSDIITIHAPLTPKTEGMIGERELSLCKDGVMIINCARGGIVDEEALYRAYKEGKVAGFALDVYKKEPPSSLPFVDESHCVLTPHLGASTQEAQDMVAAQVAKQVVEALQQGNYQNAVNIPYIKPEERDILTPYFHLAESMGTLSAQIARGSISEVHITYMGQISKYELAPLTAAFLKGLLFPIHKELVNYVNAPIFAKEKGIRIKESKQEECKDFVNLLSCMICAQGGERSVEGTVFSKDDLRIVYIDGFRIDAVPKGHLLLLSQTDEPGIIGKVGTVLGENGINIGWLQLARKEKGGEALSVWNVDAQIPPSVLERIKDVKEVLDAYYVVI